ncbi:glycosyl hydrolase family 20, catalytic domain protein [Dictyocaulus viviparus]|uniref:Glycosyl hydrolase family 20, catalytic domain protein n=1 Tax=Dictyocaulus viviparus TaxID=29172 RepID=A0A0D8Y464_DICVI|nr:glycosyl hydrolase family 20, catalytic domain protein [Dictyocaulus viviparus]
MIPLVELLYIVLDADEKLWTLTERAKVLQVKESGLGQIAFSVVPCAAGFLPYPSVSVYSCRNIGVGIIRCTDGKVTKVKEGGCMVFLLKYGIRYGGWILVITFLLAFIVYSFENGDNITHLSRRNVGSDQHLFSQSIVHLDLKGAPPILPVYTWLFPLLKNFGVRGVLIEYEDMFPYSGNLTLVRRSSHYTVQNIMEINKIAEMNDLEVIPLVQTFGHMEFILKKPMFAVLRENPSKIHALHPKSRRIHIGADEASHIGEDDRCRIQLAKMNEIDEHRALEKLKIAHIARVARTARKFGFNEVFAWNDMFDKAEVEDMHDAKLGELITPVIWGYKLDVTTKGYFPDNLFERFSQVFKSIYFASAFKGANSREENFIDLDRYLSNHMSYVKLYRENRKNLEGHVGGIILTGWQRYSHYAPLCELLAISIPSLITDLVYLENITHSRNKLWDFVKSFLKCPIDVDQRNATVTVGNITYTPHKDAFLGNCGFEGKELYKLIMQDLHKLEWKVHHLKLWPVPRNLLIMEINSLAEKVSKELTKYYYADDVNEFLNTKILILKSAIFQSMDSF